MKIRINYFLALLVVLLVGCGQKSVQEQTKTVEEKPSNSPFIIGVAERNKSPQVIVITGTASGFGKAAAERLIANGHIVYGGDINVKDNQYLSDIGGYPLEMDVTNGAQVRAGIEHIISEQGRIDVLINNAGYGEFATIENIRIDDLKHQFDVNVFGYARLQQEVLPHMRKQQSGRVIIVSSVIGKFSLPMLGWYAASKHAVEGMSDALRAEVAPFNIDVIKIQPGAANTGFGKKAFEQLQKANIPEDYRDLIEASKASLVENFARSPGPDDTAETIVEAVEVITPELAYITAGADEIVRLRKELSEAEFYKIFSGK